MEIVAVVVLAGLVAGYLVLAGCDIGLGMLLPYLTRTPAERRGAVAAMAPYFLGTEVWLVAAVGVVAGVFPALKDALLPWSWPVLVALAAAWLLRDAGLWLWRLGDTPGWRRFWEGAVTAGSWGLAVSWGLFFAGLLTGGVLLSPAALAGAVAVPALFALRGASFGAERLATAPEAMDVAARATRWLARGGLGAVLVAIPVALLPGGAALDRPLPAAVVTGVLVVLLAAGSGVSGPRWSAATSAVAVTAPLLVVAAGVALPGLTPDPATTTLVALAVGPAVPVMVLGQVWLYRLLRRQPTPAGYFA